MIKVLEFDLTDLKNAHLKEYREKYYPISKRFFWKQKDLFYCEGERKKLTIRRKNSNFQITVPINFFSNGRNVPYFLKHKFKQIGVKSETAAYYHDYLYSNAKMHNMNRKDADEIFYQIMIKSGVNKLWAWIMYKIVRFSGGNFYRIK